MLSVTVVAPTGIMADAYDTPFMVLGVDSCLKICKRTPCLECYLIYSDNKGKITGLKANIVLDCC